MGTEHSAGELPPRPDAESGEPVPPEAPTVTAEGFNEKKRSRVPKPPPGRGPVLARAATRPLHGADPGPLGGPGGGSGRRLVDPIFDHHIGHIRRIAREHIQHGFIGTQTVKHIGKIPL